jgi:hypothetical protein
MKTNKTRTEKEKSKQGRATMPRGADENEGNQVNEIVLVEQADSAEQAIEQELGDFLGQPDSQQKKILAELGRLHLSLRGPEGLLDRGNYSRPIPPPRSTSTQSRSGKTKGDR